MADESARPAESDPSPPSNRTRIAVGAGAAVVAVAAAAGVVEVVRNSQNIPAGSIRVNIHLRRPSLPPFQFHP